MISITRALTQLWHIVAKSYRLKNEVAPCYRLLWDCGGADNSFDNTQQIDISGTFYAHQWHYIVFTWRLKASSSLPHHISSAQQSYVHQVVPTTVLLDIGFKSGDCYHADPPPYAIEYLGMWEDGTLWDKAVEITPTDISYDVDGNLEPYNYYWTDIHIKGRAENSKIFTLNMCDNFDNKNVYLDKIELLGA